MLVSGIILKFHFASEIQFCNSHVSSLPFPLTGSKYILDTGDEKTFVSFDVSSLHLLKRHDPQKVSASSFL